MARVLKRTVVVGGVTYAAGTEETSSLAKKVPNEKAWEGEPDREAAPAPRKRTAKAATKAAKSSTPAAPGDSGPAAPEDSGGGSDGAGNTGEPPRGGEGATEEAWRAYAESLDVDVPDGAGRDDIVALVDARNA